MNSVDALMEKARLVNLAALDPSLVFDIRYSTANNFTGKVLYTDSFGSYLVPALAQAVVEANRKLKFFYPERRLVIFDAARPLGIQREMFDIVWGTESEPYIANPYGEFAGGFHNYGLAVDLSIIDLKNGLLDMGTDYDSFLPTAHVGREREMVLNGEMSFQAYSNRMFLFSLMGSENLLPHPCEWWHFQLDYSEESKADHSLLDF